MKWVCGGTRAPRRSEHEITGQVQGIAKQEETFEIYILDYRNEKN